MINRNRLSSILAVAALSMAGPVAVEEERERQAKTPPPRPQPRPANHAPFNENRAMTDADRERIRLAEQKRARKAARQAKGMTERQCQGRA
jgi:hypothetical protein